MKLEIHPDTTVKIIDLHEYQLQNIPPSQMKSTFKAVYIKPITATHYAELRRSHFVDFYKQSFENVSAQKNSFYSLSYDTSSQVYTAFYYDTFPADIQNRNDTPYFLVMDEDYWFPALCNISGLVHKTKPVARFILYFTYSKVGNTYYLTAQTQAIS